MGDPLGENPKAQTPNRRCSQRQCANRFLEMISSGVGGKLSVSFILLAIIIIYQVTMSIFSLSILDQALAEPGGAEGKRVVSIHKNFVNPFEKL